MKVVLDEDSSCNVYGGKCGGNDYIASSTDLNPFKHENTLQKTPRSLTLSKEIFIDMTKIMQIPYIPITDFAHIAVLIMFDIFNSLSTLRLSLSMLYYYNTQVQVAYLCFQLIYIYVFLDLTKSKQSKPKNLLV